MDCGSAKSFKNNFYKVKLNLKVYLIFLKTNLKDLIEDV